MDVLKLVADNPVTALALALVILLIGLFVGFFFRRKGMDQAVEEITEHSSFADAAARKVFATKIATTFGDAQQAHAFRDPMFGETVCSVVRKDAATREEIIKVVVCSKEFSDMIGDVVDHKKRRQAAEESAQLDLRFERLRSEISQNVREQMGASQSMLLSEIREAIKAISEVGNKLDSHIKVEAAIEQERKDAHK